MKKTAFLLALIIAASAMITACGQKDAEPAKDTTTAVQDKEDKQEDNAEKDKDAEKDETQEAPAGDGQISGGHFTKLSSLSLEGVITKFTAGGIIYKKTDQYGVASLDGKHDTGLIYDNAEGVSGHPFVMVYKEGSSAKDINICGLVDAECKEIIEPKYALIDVLNERYIKVITSTGVTENKDEALFYSSDKRFSISVQDGDTLYTGIWEIYDVEKGKLVDGATGTQAYRISAAGQYLTYSDDDGNEHTIDGEGKEVEGLDFIANDDSYILKNGDKSEVYTNDGKKLFDFDPHEYSITGVTNDGEYYKASSYNDGQTKYFIIDKTGQKISSDFEKSLSEAYAGFLYSDDKIYDYEGKVLIPGEWSSLSFDTVGKEAFSSRKDNAFVIFDKDGKVIYQDDKYNDTDHYYHDYFCVAEKDADNNYTFYNFKDHSFSIEGRNLKDWFITTKTDNYNEPSDVIDTRTGDKVIEGYVSYDPYKPEGSGKIYILAYADKEKKNEADVYVIG